MLEYKRCSYIDSANHQCNTWFNYVDKEHPNYEEQHAFLCPSHRGILTPKLAAAGIEKGAYIERDADLRKKCYAMSFDELESHIAEQEKILETQKHEVLTARAVRADKLEKMSDEERKERRKILVPKTKDPAEKKTNSPTIKKDPIEYLMAKHGISREKAMLLWE